MGDGVNAVAARASAWVHRLRAGGYEGRSGTELEGVQIGESTGDSFQVGDGVNAVAARASA